MNRTRSMFVAATLAVTALTVPVAPASAAPQDGPGSTETIHGIKCTNIQQVGTGGSAQAEGVTAVKVWQYKGWCLNNWLRFSYARVTEAFRDKPWGFRGTAGLWIGQNGPMDSAFTSTLDDWGIYSVPADMSAYCTRGAGYIKYTKNDVGHASEIAFTSGIGPGC